MRRFLVLHSSLQNHSFVKREYDGLLNILASDFDAQFDFLDNLESLPSSSKYENFIISTGGVWWELTSPSSLTVALIL